MTVKKRLQQIRYKQMVEQLGEIAKYIPQEDNTDISIYAHIYLSLQKIEEYEMQNLD